MEEQDQFCSVFDLAYKINKPFIEMIIEFCMTRAVIKKSIILPPDSEIKKIKKMKRGIPKRNELMKYILRSPYFTRTIDKLMTMDGKYVDVMLPNHYYNVKVDGKKVKLNGVELSVVAVSADKKLTLYNVKTPLVPTLRELPKKVGGGKKRKPYKTRINKKMKKKSKSKSKSAPKFKSQPGTNISQLLF
jgi:hypothetical protein